MSESSLSRIDPDKHLMLCFGSVSPLDATNAVLHPASLHEVFIKGPFFHQHSLQLPLAGDSSFSFYVAWISISTTFFIMSVSSVFAAGDEPRSSTAFRLAQSFRRASTATTSSSAGSLQEEQQRRPTFGSIESVRKSSLGGLPLLLKRSRTRAVDNVRGNSAATSPYAVSICFSYSADRISVVKA
jgi:hypothetical protein